jgi:GTP-binding protein
MPIVFVSAKTGHNIRRLVETTDEIARRLQTTLPTGVLNRVIMDACEKVQPPLVRGRRLKIFYAAQTASRPLTVRLFVNDPRRLLPAFQTYLIRRLRMVFGLEGVPLIFQLRGRQPPPGGQ